MANTINWNIPNIKSSKISATNSAYTNPQYPVADQFSMWGQVAKNFGNNVAMGINARAANQQREKDEQAALLKRRNAMTNAEYDKVAQITTLGGNEFETSKNNMLYGLKDQYVEIKLAMEDGRLETKEGAMALQQINASVQKYKEQAPLMLASATELQKALNIPMGEAGAIASSTPTPQQEILMSLIEDGNVGIKDYQGEYYLYKTGEDENGNPTEFDPTSLQVLNIDQYLKETDGGKKPSNYYQTIIDTTDEQKDAMGRLIKNENALPETYFTAVERKGGDAENPKNILTYIYKQDEKGHNIGQEALLNTMDKTSWSFITNPETVKEKNDVNNLWTDVVGRSNGERGQDTVWDPTSTKKQIWQLPGTKDENGIFRIDFKSKDMYDVVDYSTDKPKEMTPMEFMVRYHSMMALQNNEPAKLNAISGVSKDTSKANGKSFGWIAEEAIRTGATVIAGNLEDKKASWKYDKDTRKFVPHVFKGSVSTPYPKFGIPKFRKNENGEEVINMAALASGMGLKTYNKQ